MVAAYASWSARHAALVLGLVMIAACGAGIYAYSTLTVDLDDAGLISSQAPFKQAAQAVHSVFPAVEQSMTAIVEADDPTVARVTADRVADAFRARPELFSEIFAPGLGSFYDQNALMMMPPTDIQTVAVRLQRAMPLMQILSRQPDLVGLATGLDQLAIATRMKIFPPEAITLLTEIDRVGQSLIDNKPAMLDWQSTLVGDLSRNRQSWAISVKPTPGPESVAAARALIADPAITRGVAKIRLVGGPASKGDAVNTVAAWLPLAFAMILAGGCLVALLGLRSMRLFLVCVATWAATLAFAAAAGAAILGSVGLPAIVVAALLAGVLMDLPMLFALRFREERLGGRDQARALAVAAKSCGLPSALAFVAMTIAFLAFWSTDLVGVAEIGLVVAATLAIMLLAGHLLVPALLVLLPINPRRGRPASSQVLATIAGVLTSQPVRFLVTLPIVAAAAASVLLLRDVEFERDARIVAQPMTGAAQVMVTGEQQARSLYKAIEALPEVGAAISVFNFVPSGQDTKLAILGDVQGSLPPALEGTPQTSAEQAERGSIGQLERALNSIASSNAPETARAAAQTVEATLREFAASKGTGEAAIAELETALLTSLSPTIARLRMLADASRISLDTLDPELKRRYLAPNGQFLIDISAKSDLSDRGNLKNFVTAVQSVAPQASGPAVDAYETAVTLRQALLQVLAVSAGVIALLLISLLPRFYDVLLVAIPVTLALLILAGAMVLLDLPVVPLTALAVPLLIGLGVGNGIKLLMRARESVRYNNAARPSTPRAILWTTLAIMVGAATLLTAPLAAPILLGKILIAGLALLTACTFIVLPTLVYWTLPSRRR